MKRKIEVSELIFKIIAYVLLIIFSILCVYPLLYALGSTFSSWDAVEQGKVILWPVGFQIESFKLVFMDNQFWINYSNTLFVTFIGTIWCLVYSILGAYALSKKRLMGRHGFNFFLVFTMWFSAGVIPQYLNYQQTGTIMASIVGGSSMYDIDLKWLIVLAMGMNATNIILLRNSFEGVPSEIEEAARIDGLNNLQIYWKIVMPLSKPALISLGIYHFMNNWNDLLYPMMLTSSVEKRTLSAGLAILVGSNSIKYGPTLAATVISIAPLLLLFLFGQRFFIEGIATSGVKE